MERERALLLELEELRAENEHLRTMYAQSLNGQSPALAQHHELPKSTAYIPLPLTLDNASSSATAQLEYEALFAAMASVFPIGVFRTDHAGVLTHVDENLQHIFALQREDFPISAGSTVCIPTISSACKNSGSEAFPPAKA